MTPQELKNSILQQAIQGKLVEQRPEEGTAEELYQQIQAEKKRLIAEKKIKKGKPLPEITEEEKPFEIPESWKWVRLASIATLNPKNVLDDSMSTSFIPMACVSDGYRNEHTYEVRKWGEIKKGFSHFRDGDLGIAKITPCFQNRKSTIFKGLENGYGAGTTELSIVRVIGDTLEPKYLLWFFKSHHFIFNGIKSFTGTAGQQRIHKDYLPHCLIPLPPLAEQKRIVAKIEKLLPLIDRYEAAWSRLEAFNKRFPEEMQKSILQQAIQGKLVEQRPEEGTGEELYQQIQAEKQRLIKEKKIKKDKPLPEITDDEKPFDIPDSWKWVKLAAITSKITDGEHKTPRRVSSYCGYYLLSARNVRDGSIALDNVDYVDKEEFEQLAKRCNPLTGDVLISCSGSVGRCAVVNDDNNYVMVRSAAMVSPIIFDSRFLMYAIRSECIQSQVRNRTKQTAQANLFQDAIRNLVVPFPPLAEQKRIVAKIEELLPLCEKLKH